MLAQFWNMVVNSVSRFDWLDAVDILLVAVLIYYTLKLASRTRAMQVLKGLAIMLIAALLSELFRLQTVAWILNYIINIGAILLIVLFQPELRRAFEQLGRKKLLVAFPKHDEPAGEDPEFVQELTHALLNMAKKRIGALIVIQRYVALDDVVETGTRVDGKTTAAILECIFMPNTPLHDGATIIKNGEIIASGCFLPLTSRDDLPKTLGTRHRAAVGLSEVSDSIIFVVSEETGVISMAREGRLVRNLDAAGIRKALNVSASSVESQNKSILARIREKSRRKADE